MNTVKELVHSTAECEGVSGGNLTPATNFFFIFFFKWF